MLPPWKLVTISSNTTWRSVTISAPADTENTLWALLEDLGAEGVSTFSGNPESNSPREIQLTGYFPTEQNVDELVSQLRALLTNRGIAQNQVVVTTDLTSPEQWAENWKQYYLVTRVTRYLTIVPSWDHAYQPTPGELLIRLDPELAFGTGTHPTTTLALLALEQVIRGEEQVIDVGTGSGVLAIAAMLLGAGGVLATDIDEDTLTVARTNIALNPAAQQVCLKATNLLSEITQSVDIIIANILAEVLVELVDDASRLLNSNGHLILSGIYHDKVQLITEQVLQAGLTIKMHLSQGEWHCLIAAN